MSVKAHPTSRTVDPVAMAGITELVSDTLALGQLVLRDTPAASKFGLMLHYTTGSVTYDVNVSMQRNTHEDFEWGLDVSIELSGGAPKGDAKVEAQNNLLDRLREKHIEIRGHTSLVEEFTFSVPSLHAEPV